MTNSKKPVIIDVDTGIDDALAIILALRSKKVALKAITTVAGNTTDVGQVTKNTLKILNLIDAPQIPIAKGAESFLSGQGKSASTTGTDGLCNVSNTLELPDKDIEDKKAVDFIKKTLKSSEKKITFVGTAPPTNLAQFIKKYPKLKEKIAEVILMGGAVETDGNITKFAEFNFYNDPKAVATIFQSGLPVTIAPLDVTEKLLITKEWLVENYGQSRDSVTRFFKKAVVARHELLGYDWMHLHDPLAMGVAINKNFVKTKTDNFNIVPGGKKRGMLQRSDQGHKISWANKVKKVKFESFFERQMLKK